MVMITIYELERLSDAELAHLHRRLTDRLMASCTASADRRNILATLENIETVLGQRQKVPTLRR